MRVFVTGASGWIGSAVLPELITAGHQVLGLARSDASAEKITAAGAEVLRGDLGDLDALGSGAAGCDGVIHLAYIHDFTQMKASAQTDALAIETMGAALAGSNKPMIVASGTPVVAGRASTERDDPPSGGPAAGAVRTRRRHSPWPRAGYGPRSFGCLVRCTARVITTV